MATMRLEVNGSFYSSKIIKHIKDRYFFSKNRIEDGELEVKYWPTENMWTDILNKPDQRMKSLNYIETLMDAPVD